VRRGAKPQIRFPSAFVSQDDEFRRREFDGVAGERKTKSQLRRRNVRKLVSLLTISVVCALVVTAFALAAARKTVWTAALSSGQEVPKQVVKDTAAHGLFKATLSGTTLKWKLTFAKLTGPATASHIHMAAKGKSGNIIIPLCGPCTSGMTGTATVTAAQMTAFKKHLLYVNVHTAKNPAGEIRGQLASG
jgi:hypothetical protein